MDSRIGTALPSLLDLARDRSEAGRLALADRLAELFLGIPATLSAEDQAKVESLIDEILSANSAVLRRQLAKHLDTAARLPRKIALTFLQESIDVARPILIACEQLSDDDLITIVETSDTDYALAVAARKQVNEAVADALITTGDLGVMQAVAENLGARLSVKAIKALTEAARSTKTLQHPMILRPEMTVDVALRLYWWMEQDLRRAALERFTPEAGQLDGALAAAIEDKLNDHILERFNTDAMVTVADWLEERGSLSPKIMPQILRMGHFHLFYIILGRLAGLPFESVKAIVCSHGGRPLAAVCRALNVEKPLFVSIFLLSRGARPDEHIVNPGELTYALAAFDRLTPTLGNDMVSTWRLDPSYLLSEDAQEAMSAEA